MSKRTERVASQIHKEVALLLQRRLRDPRLEGLTITRVEVSPDLHYAWVYVDLISRPAEMPDALEALAHAARFIRGEIRQSLRMRYTPELLFEGDKGLEHSERIHHVLQELRERGELPSDDEDGAAEPGAGELETEGLDEDSADEEEVGARDAKDQTEAADET